MKEKNRIRFLIITWRILFGLRILICVFIFISILEAVYYLITEPPQGLPCLMCDGCPCPYYDFIKARNQYLKVLFPMIISLYLTIIIIISILIAYLRHKFNVLKLARFKKRYGNSEDLFRVYKSSLESSELDLKSKRK